MIKQIIVHEIYSDEDLKSIKGEYLDDGWIHQLIDEDCDIYNSDNKFVLSFRKKKIKSTEIGFQNYKKLIGSSRGRGASAGPLDPESNYWKDKQLAETKKYTTKYVNKNGKVSNMKVNNLVYSVPIGYFDKLKGTLGLTLPNLKYQKHPFQP